MRLKLKFFGKRLLFDFGMREPDLITANDVRFYANKDQLSPRLVRVNKLLTKSSKRYRKTFVYVKDLLPEEIDILQRRGFTVTCRTKTIKGTKTVKLNHFKVSA